MLRNTLWICIVLSHSVVPTPYDPMDCSPSGSSVLGISQARLLEWVAIFCSRGSSWPRDRTWVSCIGRQMLYHCATWEAYYFSVSIPSCPQRSPADPLCTLLLLFPTQCPHPFSTEARVRQGSVMRQWIFIGVELIYSVVLVSGVQQSDSVTSIYIYIFFIKFFSITGDYKIVTIVPWATQ